VGTVSAGNTLVVPDGYASIQAAIDAAASGDTVEVKAGVYDETLRFKSGVDLKGAGADITIVRAASTKGVLLKVENAESGRIEGLTFEHADVESLDPCREDWTDAVALIHSAVEIRNCVLGPSAGCGISMEQEGNTIVTECRAVENARAGIFMRHAGTKATLLRNECSNNRMWGGIVVWDGATLTAEENTCSGNCPCGIRAYGRETSFSIKDNLLADNRGSGIDIEAWATGVAEANVCRGNQENGILLRMGVHGTVFGNTCEENRWCGIVVKSLLTDIEVRGNTCRGNHGNGIDVCFGAVSGVSGNTCVGNGWSGISVSQWFTAPAVVANECTGNGTHGLCFALGAGGRGEGNVCRQNKEYGILVTDEGTTPELGRNIGEDNGKENVARLDGAPVSGQYQVVNKEAGWALAAGQFDQIEEIGARIRRHKCRDWHGTWQLEWLYDGLGDGEADITPDKRDAFKATLDRWQEAYPNSVMPLIVQAKTHIDYGWDARGSGYANTVTKEGWRVFHREIGIAEDYLLKAEALNGDDPELYAKMITVGMASNNSSREQQAIFEKGIGIELGYYPLYQRMAYSLTPRWGGRPGELERFAEHAVEQTRGQFGTALYAVIAQSILGCVGEENFVDDHFFKWKMLDQGFEELREAYPNSNWRLNQHCLLACIYRDQEKAKVLFEKIRGDVDDSIWHYGAGFHPWKQWAFGLAPAPAKEPTKHTLASSFVDPVGEVLDSLPEEVASFVKTVLWAAAVAAVVILASFIALATHIVRRRGRRGIPPPLP